MGATARSIGPRSTEPKNFKPKNGRIRLHAPPQSLDEPQPRPSNLCKPAQNFTKLTIQGSCTALDQQNPKISGLKAQARTAKRFGGATFNPTRQLGPPKLARATRSSTVTSWMTSSTADPFVQIQPGLTRKFEIGRAHV